LPLDESAVASTRIPNDALLPSESCVLGSGSGEGSALSLSSAVFLGFCFAPSQCTLRQ
jgi:hypothetical protein